MRVRAPGKVVLMGEYAVLDGAPSLVAAVDRGVQCTVGPADQLRIETPGSDDRFVRPALDAVRAPAGRYRFEPYNLPDTATKVGLGSSAAATVAACVAGSRGALSGQALFDVAYRVHHTVQGSGSGIDVAASSFGGVQRFQQGRCTPARAVQPVVVWSGSSALTGPRVQQYRKLEAKTRAAFVEQTEGLLDQFEREPVEAFRGAWRALCAMSEAAGIAYRTEGLDRIVALAEQHGGGAKPSGAGGGDIAVALFTESSQRRAFEAAVVEAGFRVVAVQLAGPPQLG